MGLSKPIVAQRAFGRMQTARPLEPVLGAPCSQRMLAGEAHPCGFIWRRTEHQYSL